jgi:hypothetical protein
MRRHRSLPKVRFLVAAVLAGLMAAISAATALASNGPGPWP